MFTNSSSECDTHYIKYFLQFKFQAKFCEYQEGYDVDK